MRAVTIASKKDIQQIVNQSIKHSLDAFSKVIRRRVDDLIREKMYDLEMKLIPLIGARLARVTDDAPIEVLGLTTRARNALQPYGVDPNGMIKTVGHLAAFTPGELIRIRNLGKKTLLEIEYKLSRVGFALGYRKPSETAAPEGSHR